MRTWVRPWPARSEWAAAFSVTLCAYLPPLESCHECGGVSVEVALGFPEPAGLCEVGLDAGAMGGGTGGDWPGKEVVAEVQAVDDVLAFFFFQAEDGIRDLTVTGVQTCALPI